MSIRHTENVKQVTDWRAVDTGKYVTVEVDYVTASGIKKTLRLPHCVADAMRVAIVSEFESLDDDKRTRSFWASLRRNR
jgi:hypothetical protein